MLRYLKKYWFYTLIAPLFMVGEVLMDLIQPRLMNTIVDEGVLGLNNNGISDLSVVLNTGLKMIGCVLLGGAFGVLCGVFTNMSAQNFANDMRKDCFKSVMNFSFEQTDKFTAGSLVTRITNDVTQVQNMLSMCIRGFVRNIMFFIGGIVCMLRLELSFGIVAACALPILGLLVVCFIKKANPIFAVLQSKLDRVNSVMQENVTGVRVVKAFVKEDYEKERFSKANDDLVSTQLRVLLLLSYLSPIMNVIMNAAVVGLIYIGAIEVKNGVATPGNIMAAVTYISQILGGVMMLAMFFQTMSRGSVSAKRLKELTDCTPSIEDGYFCKKTDIKGEIEFKNVSFTYNKSMNDNVIDNVSFKIFPGETIGILGSTGCGKSSIVSLIPRFYDACSGEVLVDGINVKDYKLSVLRDRIAFALQKSELFADTVENNIRWGNPNASSEEIKCAAKTAQADSFIEEMPEKYNTRIAEKGASLSGGQKQRISISRAVLKNAEIMIFDDSTSALDLKTEARLYASLNERYPDITKIIIAQRISSVKNADRVMVVENGKIAGFDSPEKLMQNCAVYRDIYSSQLKGGEEYA